MKERALSALQEARELEISEIEKVWIVGGWSKLKSLVEVGIDPTTTILSLWEEEGDMARDYAKHEKEMGLSKMSHQDLWGALTLFENFVDGIWVGEDDVDAPLATIEDFLDIKAEDLEGFEDFTLLQRKMIERLFASSTSKH